VSLVRTLRLDLFDFSRQLPRIATPLAPLRQLQLIGLVKFQLAVGDDKRLPAIKAESRLVYQQFHDGLVTMGRPRPAVCAHTRGGGAGTGVEGRGPRPEVLPRASEGDRQPRDAAPTLQSGSPMTTKDVLDAANDAAPGARLRRYEAICGPRGACRREPCANDPGRWTFCPDCLTVFDDYGKAVNQIREIQRPTGGRILRRSVKQVALPFLPKVVSVAARPFGDLFQHF
jgi:hypothetical protein